MTAGATPPHHRGATELRRFFRFLVVGLSNTAVSGLLFLLCHRALHRHSAGAAVAQAISYSAGIAWSYFWNLRWTFGRAGARRDSVARFVALQLTLLATSTLAIGMLVDRLGAPAVPAWLVVMAAITLVNFLASRAWVFRPHEEAPPSRD